ncbi:MAG: ATP-dependent zinc metalloprotease FtsH [Bacteroidales bacterium]|jgi:cell division protease FtsH|nr:ATP-dependent zinc metalloprotease FtsH [Bacteroidales bacterium]
MAEKDTKMPKMPKFNPYWIYGIVAVALILISTMGSSSSPQSLAYGTFEKKLLGRDGVEKIVIIRNELKAEVTLKVDSVDNYRDLFANQQHVPTTGPHFIIDIPSIDSFEASRKSVEEARHKEILVYYEQRTSFFGDILSVIWPILLMIVLYVVLFRRMAGGSGGAGIFSVGKSQAKMLDKDANVNVTFKDVAGLSGAKEELEEIVEFLRHPEKYTELGGKIPKGALLVGPPGTGKTLLAKAVAGEANVPFFSMSGSDFVEMFVGVGASRVRDLFKKAKDKAPSIIFIDEIDAIGRARGRNGGFSSNEERENTLNQLLTEMDGFGTNSGVIILAATNRADILDRALMRAGRFDRQISVELPDIHERDAIFEVHLRPLKLATDFDRSFLAKQTPGFSGADIANVCNEAALTAARKGKKEVDKQDFLDAIDRIVGGLEKKDKIITPEERRAIAIHEAGHATISWLLEGAHPLVKVTIVPRGKALGAAWYLPEERQLVTKEQILDEMCSTLGGRAAEENVLGRISTGALNDLEKVTRSAYALVSYYGMSDKIPNISYYDSTGQSDYAFSKPYSETRATVIDSEASKIVETQYARAKSILSENAEKHMQLANLLLEREVIFSDDLEHIFGPRKGAKPAEEDSEKPKEEPKAELPETATTEGEA